MTQRPASPVKITLIGLDRVGASIGLALRPRESLRLTGFDRNTDTARLAQKRGLVHQAQWNLLEATDGADLILLGGPLSDQREWLQAFAPTLREQAVVASLGPLLAPPLAWAAELLPPERHFVAAHPILNPTLLHDGALGLEAARADLFKDGLWALAAAPDCAPEALKLLADLAGLLGAQAYYADAAEHDGLMGSLDAMPALLALALMQVAEASPGWYEARKLADRDFATATLALSDADAAALRLNRENVLRYLEAALAQLQAMREWIAKDDRAALEQALTEAAERRAQWLAEREKGEWEKPTGPAMEVPTLGETFGRFVFGGLFKRKR